LSHANLGTILKALGRGVEAEEACQRAVTVLEKLADEFPNVPQYRADLASCHNQRGSLLRELGKPPESEMSLRQALAILNKLASEHPAVPRYHRDLAICHNELGLLFRDLAKWPQAEEAFRRALSVREKLAADYPTVPSYRVELGGDRCNLGNLLRASKQPQRALEWYDKAIATLNEALRQAPSDEPARRFLRNAHWGRARAFDDLGRPADAVADWDKAVELSPAPERAEFRANRALSRARAGQAEPAAREAEELAHTADAPALYNAACILALASAPSQAAALSSEARDKYARRAVELLRQAVARGWKDIEHMKRDEDLKSLRDRPDFKNLLAELERQSGREL
jgi:tetratricopeptide (TPR) repeat protein